MTEHDRWTRARVLELLLSVVVAGCVADETSFCDEPGATIVRIESVALPDLFLAGLSGRGIDYHEAVDGGVATVCTAPADREATLEALDAGNPWALPPIRPDEVQGHILRSDFRYFNTREGDRICLFRIPDEILTAANDDPSLEAELVDSTMKARDGHCGYGLIIPAYRVRLLAQMIVETRRKDVPYLYAPGNEVVGVSPDGHVEQVKVHNLYWSPPDPEVLSQLLDSYDRLSAPDGGELPSRDATPADWLSVSPKAAVQNQESR